MDAPEVTLVEDNQGKNPKVLALLRALGLPPEQTGDVTLTVGLPVASVVTVQVQANVFMTEAQIEKLTELLASDEAKVEVVKLAHLVALDDMERS